MAYSQRQRDMRKRARELEPVLALLKSLAPGKSPRELARAARQLARDASENNTPLAIIGQGDSRVFIHPKRRIKR